MIILNDGKTETCVRAQGSSMVDVTIATEAAVKYVKGWRVDGEAETLSDHKYIRMNIGEKLIGKMEHRGKLFPRWNVKRCDKDWCSASVIGGMWLNDLRIKEFVKKGEIEKADAIIKRVVTDACDNSMKRQKAGMVGKNKVYWWNTQIAELREKCGTWRKRLTRAKRRETQEVVTQLAGALNESRKELKKAIGKAKKEAWNELLEGLK